MLSWAGSERILTELATCFVSQWLQVRAPHPREPVKFGTCWWRCGMINPDLNGETWYSHTQWVLGLVWGEAPLPGS